VGPLRIWPGGLCLSRAIGDFDVGDSVIPFPHIMQVRVPRPALTLYCTCTARVQQPPSCTALWGCAGGCQGAAL
jgi:hypothetical protein